MNQCDCARHGVCDGLLYKWIKGDVIRCHRHIVLYDLWCSGPPLCPFYDLLDELDREMDRLFRCKEEDTVLMAFPMNPKSCSAYRGCQFHDFCLSWSNPLQRCYEPPLGFKEEFWDPSQMDTTVKKDLEWSK